MFFGFLFSFEFPYSRFDFLDSFDFLDLFGFLDFSSLTLTLLFFVFLDSSSLLFFAFPDSSSLLPFVFLESLLYESLVFWG